MVKTKSVSRASEHKQHTLAHSLIDDNVATEMGPFTSTVSDGGEQIKEVSIVYVPNIIRNLADIVENHEQ